MRRGKKRTLVILATLLLITLAFKFGVTNWFWTLHQTFPTPHESVELKISNEPSDKDISDPHGPRFYNIILEEEALKFQPCQDVKTTASITHSKLTLSGRVKRTYNIGEEIRAIVTLHDGYGKRKHSGGDHLRATIENRATNASAPCVVSDNYDGTHGVVCNAFWSGSSTVYVTLVYTRETITSIYWIKTKVLSTRLLGVKFEANTYSEVSICHQNNTYLLQLTSYTDVCNMTYINAGEPFYCGKPKNKHLRCQDTHMAMMTKLPPPNFNFTQCEEILLQRGQQVFERTLEVKVRSKKGDSRVSLIDKPSIPCSVYNISLLWRSRAPTGFFYNGKWILQTCLGFKQNLYKTCLRNRRLYVFGDSTTRGWYAQIRNRFNCQQITGKWTNEKWYRDSECYNKEINFKAGWYPHHQPFFGRTFLERNDSLYPNSVRIERIPRTTRAIVIIHLYLHMVAFHHSFFKQRMEKIRKSVDKLLTKNKQSIVMIKAPQTFEKRAPGNYSLDRPLDYFGYVYSKLLYEIFEGLHGRVVLLNNRDATIAQHVDDIHPPKHIQNAMTDQMLSYACDKGQQVFERTLEVKVRSKKGDSRVSLIDKPSISCSVYNISLLWRSRAPTGFFYNGKWILQTCLGFKQNLYKTCLRNRRLYVFGDSTTRGWYAQIRNRFNCQQITGKWTNEKWYRDSECYNKEINFKAGWYPHHQPFFGRTFLERNDSLYPNSVRIERIPRTTRAIVIIHLYLHMVAFHHSFFKQRMEKIRKSVDKLLTKNKQSIVMIKAPQTFEKRAPGNYSLDRPLDYFGYVYSKLLYEIFEGLHGRVVLLNNRDATIAQHVDDIHPPKHIQNAMTDQMLSYACDK